MTDMQLLSFHMKLEQLLKSLELSFALDLFIIYIWLRVWIYFECRIIIQYIVIKFEPSVI